MNHRCIFISHSPADHEWVRAFAQSLVAQGAQVWLDDMQIQPGDSFAEALEEGLRKSDVIAFVITPDNVRGPSLLFELGVAIGMGKRAVPIIANDVAPSELPGPLRLRQSLPRESPEETARKLILTIAA